MSDRTSQPGAHNAPWRRIRRRIYVGPWSTWLLYAFFWTPSLCVVAWLNHGGLWPWVFQITRALWFAVSLFYFCISLLMGSRQARASTGQMRARIRRIRFITPLLSGANAATLVIGHVDWAIAVYAGAPVPKALVSAIKARSVEHLVGIAGSCLLISGAFTHSLGLVVAGILLPFCKVPARCISLRKVVAAKPRRAAYVAGQQEKCAAGGG